MSNAENITPTVKLACRTLVENFTLYLLISAYLVEARTNCLPFLKGVSQSLRILGRTAVGVKYKYGYLMPLARFQNNLRLRRLEPSGLAFRSFPTNSKSPSANADGLLGAGSATAVKLKLG